MDSLYDSHLEFLVYFAVNANSLLTRSHLLRKRNVHDRLHLAILFLSIVALLNFLVCRALQWHTSLAKRLSSKQGRYGKASRPRVPNLGKVWTTESGKTALSPKNEGPLRISVEPFDPTRAPWVRLQVRSFA